MIRKLIYALALVSITGCSGVLSYQQNDSVFVGPLDKLNLNEMKSSGKLLSLSSFEKMEYAIDRGGDFVGICRTNIPKKTTDRDGTMELDVFNVLRQKTIAASEEIVAIAMDKKLGINVDTYQKMIIPDTVYLNCYRMGASGKDGALVLYLQPQGLAEFQDVAVEIDVQAGVLNVLDIEFFHRTGAPSNVVALDNPTKGNTVNVSTGAIRINGAPVLLNGNPVSAESVKHQFD